MRRSEERKREEEQRERRRRDKAGKAKNRQKELRISEK